VIHTTHKDYPLNNQNHALSLKPIHQNHSTITYKTTNQAKNKKIQIKKAIELFSVLETQQLQHRLP
jgi:hypothetical protein